jgi:hypothetical protein
VIRTAVAERLLHRVIVALIAIEADEGIPTFIFPTELIARLRHAIGMCQSPVQLPASPAKNGG